MLKSCGWVGWVGGWVAYVIIESPQSQFDLDFWFWNGLGRLDLGLGLDNISSVIQATKMSLYAMQWKRLLELFKGVSL